MPPCPLTSTSFGTPALRSDSATSRTTACRVAAEMLTVPGHPACSCEQEIVTGGSSRTGCASAISAATVQAITVSVASGRNGPCCSKLPTGSTATRTSRSSALVCIGTMRPTLPRRPATPPYSRRPVAPDDLIAATRIAYRLCRT
ncbi:hypothetical protein GCM10009727_64210 [Actinomadura napierensis]|uniref:Uncharacterized protein n=1 Tax=Actinomadura napierensis TaxID=267854 RepID=A0ABN3A7Y8_9ACTN